jgi:hypothetical protein
MNTQALPIHLKQTAKFVDENPQDIVFNRETKVADGMGGWRKNATAALPPQTMRMVAQERVGSVTTRTTPDGRIVTPTFKLVGVPPIDVQALDTFSIGDDDYEVVYVSTSPAWRVTADVIEHA